MVLCVCLRHAEMKALSSHHIHYYIFCLLTTITLETKLTYMLVLSVLQGITSDRLFTSNHQSCSKGTIIKKLNCYYNVTDGDENYAKKTSQCADCSSC